MDLKTYERIRQSSFIDELEKIAYNKSEVVAPKGAEEPGTFVKKRFSKIEDMLKNEGVYAGTYHKRIVIPKSKLSETDIRRMKFVPSLIAIPESGQDRFQSFRNPENNYHIHSHPNYWTIHEDQYPSSQMLALKAEKIRQKAGAYIKGAPHAITEGVPGLFVYTKNSIKRGGQGMVNSILSEFSKKDLQRMNRWVPSRTLEKQIEKKS